MPHNHPPRCCCEDDPRATEPNNRTIYPLIRCPSCIEHGELAQLASGICGFRHLIAPDQVCTLPPHPIGTVHSWDRPAECASCHQPEGRPHTEYCKRENREYPGQPGVRPDGRNLEQHDGTVDLVGHLRASVDAARTRRQQEAQATATVGLEYVDDGCRCPTRTPHSPGCPVLPHVYGITMNGDTVVDASCATCGGPKGDYRHVDIDRAQAGPVPVDRPECGHANWPDCAVLHTP